MDAGKAVELHFADDVISRDKLYDTKTVPKLTKDPDEEPDEDEPEEQDGPDKDDPDKKKDHASGMLFSRYQVAAAINRKLIDYAKYHPDKKESPVPQAKDTTHLHRIDDLEKRLDLMKQFI